MQVTNLRVEVSDLPITEYRANDGNLEFRLLDSNGHIYPDWRSEWRRLTPSDVALHFRVQHGSRQKTRSLIGKPQTRQ